MYIVIFFLKTLGIWTLCVLPGVWLGQRLAAKGIARDQSIPFSIENFVLILLDRTSNLIPDTWWWYAISTIIAFFGAYRYEFAITKYRGRWWWKKEAIVRNAEQPLPLLLKIGVKIWVALIIALVILSVVLLVIRLFEAGFQLK